MKRARWIADTLAQSTDWPVRLMERRLAGLLPTTQRELEPGDVEIVACEPGEGGLAFFPDRGPSLLVHGGTHGLRLEVPEDELYLRSDNDVTGRRQLIQAVTRRFGKGPAEHTAGGSLPLPPAGHSQRLLSDDLLTGLEPERGVAQPAPKSTPLQPPPARKRPEAAPARGVEVFISYSRQDRKWLERLQTHLTPLQRQGRIDVWVDTRIRAGDEWRKEIERAIASCKVAILLVSPYFMASDFINNNELPPLLKKARQKGVRIISILISPSSYEDSELARYQAVNPPSKPLRALERWEQDKVLDQVRKQVKQALGI